MQTQSASQNDAEELDKTAARVNKLMEAKEISKSAAAVWGTGDRVSPQQVEQKFATTQHIPDDSMPIQDRFYTEEEKQRMKAFAERVGHRIAKSFKKYSRKSGPGPGGGRFEHWQAVGDDDVISDRMGHVLARLAINDVPAEVSRALLSARLNGIRKSNGGCRVL